MVLILFKTAKTKKHIANFRFSYQIQSVVHYVDYLSEDITQGLLMFLASKRLRLPISSERNRPFLRKERETHFFWLSTVIFKLLRYCCVLKTRKRHNHNYLLSLLFIKTHVYTRLNTCIRWRLAFYQKILDTAPIVCLVPLQLY